MGSISSGQVELIVTLKLNGIGLLRSELMYPEKESMHVVSIWSFDVQISIVTLFVMLFCIGRW